MDVVLVGLSGSGKSAVGRRLAQRTRADFVDLDERIEAATGRSIPEIFTTEGEPAFRAHERAAIDGLGAPSRGGAIERVIASGGGAVVDPRNRWALYRSRLAVWLDGRPEVLAQRLRRSPNVRPLVSGRDPIGTIRELANQREPYYAAARFRIGAAAELPAILAAIERAAAGIAPASLERTPLLHAETSLGRILLGDGIAVDAIGSTLRMLGARRAILVSEPGAWAAQGSAIADGLAAADWPIETILLPEGEAAKRLEVVADAARDLARRRVERSEPLVAIGGGALTDTAGFLAATWLRGVPIIQVPTTLAAQVDAAIGGKTGVDLPEGKNLVGAFHQPAAVVIDIRTLATLPPRDLRAALAEAVKMAALGDARLFETLERDGPAIAAGDPEATRDGALADVVERCAWAKIAVVAADERERDPASGRIRLNLGHSLGHAVEAAAGYADLRHGEAVAYGLRAACRIGVALEVTPEARAARIMALLDRLGLAIDPLPYSLDAVLDHLGADKKHAGGRLRWILPTADGVTVRDDVDPSIVEAAASSLLAAGARR